MESEKATILVVGGGWHTPQSYSKLTKQLESKGYEVRIPILPSMNESRPPNMDFISDTNHIRTVAEGLVNEGRDIVVLMHSYGGQVGTNALYGLGLEQRKKQDMTGGISALLYLAAYAIQEGKAMIDGVKHFGHEHLMPLAFDFADDMSCVSRDPKALLVGETDLPAAEVDKYLASLVRWNGQAMYQPLTTPRAAWRDIPVTYVHTTQDMTVPHEYQKWFIEEMEKEGVEVQTVTLESGHCANFTSAKEVAEIVDAVVKRELRSGPAEGASGTSGTSKDDVQEAILHIVS
jgi:pimeloyl-ACP methyl ester carboxylesterase